MDKQKIKQLIGFNIVDCPVYINNSIFNELLKCNLLSHISHLSYAYGYYCLITHLYRNAKYQNFLLKQSDLKEILGYSPNNRSLDFISKMHGLLDELGYTETITDFPVRIDTGKLIVVDMYRKVKCNSFLNIEVPSNYRVKLPVRAFYKDSKSKQVGELNGSYYEASDCHKFDLEMFIDCVSNNNIGCTGFFIASFIKALNIIPKSGPFSNLVGIAKMLRIQKKTLRKYVKHFAENGILEVDYRHNQDVKVISIYLRQQLEFWREKCLKKHKSCCLITGSKDHLEIHHVDEPFALIRDRVFQKSGIDYKPFDEYHREELDFLKFRIVQEHYGIEGIPLREDIHKLLHKIYGNFPRLENIYELKKWYLNLKMKD